MERNSKISSLAVANEFEIIAPHYSETRRIIRVFFGRKLAVVGLVFILILIITAIFGPLLAPYDPTKMELSNVLAQPSWQHLLGTNALGQDTLSRVIYGARTSIIVGIAAVGASALIGETMGLLAAHYGGIVFAIIMRFTDMLM